MQPVRGSGFDTNESAIEDDENTNESQTGPPVRRVFGRVSFDQNPSQHRPSFTARWKSVFNSDIEAGPNGSPSQANERPPIPSALQAPEVPTTPLPMLSMIVLSITMLGEFLCANVSTPFLLFMVKGFDSTRDEASVAFWTGILVSAFFMTQFITSLLWATVADKHGRRIVLSISLLGSAITCVIFGTCTTLPQAIAVRLLQGIFAGAVGVARGGVAFITDTSNEGRAYAILGFCWGFGGVAGAIIGGAFETPATKWPTTFEKFALFVDYPYLLPCALAASITFLGSVLSCFLGRDGGPREGAIRLAPEKFDAQHPPIAEEESTPPSPLLGPLENQGVSALPKRLSAKISGYFSKRVPDAPSAMVPLPPSPPALSSSLSGNRLRTFSRTSRADGSAYGYNPSFRRRLTSSVGHGTRKNSTATSPGRRRGSNSGIPSSMSDASDLNFAQRLLLANENAVTNIADLWVAAAMNVDNEDPFQSESDNESAYEEAIGDDERDFNMEPTSTDPDITPSSVPSRPGQLHHVSMSRRTSNQTVRPDIGSSRRQSASAYGSPGGRHMSFSSRRFSSNMPAIFAHPGVRPPSAVIDAQQLLARSEDPPVGESLPPILESRPVSHGDITADAMVFEKSPSLSSQLPLMIIAQYGLLALHSTTHDQIFMSYLVSDYQAGGLNLNAGRFAQLIALMCLAQIAYQFYLYPNMGPPRGRFSHLAMFRIGSFLFIPAYLTVILYRPLSSSSQNGNVTVMAGLAISTAVRYCAITFAYTAISILLNYMTPPAAVGIANGIAQSIVSLARCFGPVLGGYLWSISVQDNPSGYPFGFLAVSAVCGLVLAQSFMIE